jgi:hypothetical protein
MVQMSHVSRRKVTLVDRQLLGRSIIEGQRRLLTLADIARDGASFSTVKFRTLRSARRSLTALPRPNFRSYRD